jgi:hypothetical protein
MGAVNSFAAATVSASVVYHTQFGGTANTARKRYVIRFTDETNGIAVGGETNTFNVANINAKLGLGLAFIDRCSSLLVYTTATGASLRVINAAPNYNGDHINFGNYDADGDNDIGDVTIASTDTGQIVIEGF